jgi:hypothetical protein
LGQRWKQFIIGKVSDDFETSFEVLIEMHNQS